MTDSVGMWARLNTTYRCVSPASIPVGGATVTFSGVRMEAYMTQEDLSPAGNTNALVFPLFIFHIHKSYFKKL